MIDIISADNLGLGLLDTDVEKARNVLNVQLGSLEYEPDFGVDLEFFLDPNFEYQNASFEAYLVERLAQSSINVTSVINVVQALTTKLTLAVNSRQTETNLVR